MRTLGTAVSLVLAALLSGCASPPAANSGSGSRQAATGAEPRLEPAVLDSVEAGATPVQATPDSTEPPPKKDPALASQYAQLYDAERVAAEVFDELATKWGGRPFTKIAEAERTHTDAVATLVVRNGGTPPAGLEPGKYEAIEIQALYDAMLKRGLESLPAAMDTGAEIEEMSVRDLLVWLGTETDPQAKKILEQLLEGSANHLKAFLRARKALGMPAYETKYLTAEQAKKYREGAE